MTKIKDWQWEDFFELTSTNDKAKEKSLGLKNEKFVITSQRQNAGRGRRGRSWIGCEGNLFMSLGIECSLRDLGQIIFVVSLSLAEVILEYKPSLDVKLKWPNDVLINGAKISGILLEKGDGDYLIIGIGVNIKNAPKSDNIKYAVSSLYDAGIDVDRLEFLQSYLTKFDENINLWKKEGFGIIRQKWLSMASHRDQEIRVVTEKEEKTGIFKGVDDNGILLLQTANGEEKIFAGDVFFKDI